MDESWMKPIITIIIAVVFIGVIIGIAQPSYNTAWYRENVTLTKSATVPYVLTYDNLVDGSLVVQNATQTFVEVSDYNITESTGRLYPGNLTTLAGYVLSYNYYPDAYDTGASGGTTRMVAQLLPLGFVLVCLVLIFGWAMQHYRKE